MEYLGAEVTEKERQKDMDINPIYVFGKTLPLIMYMMRDQLRSLYMRTRQNRAYYRSSKDIMPQF